MKFDANDYQTLRLGLGLLGHKINSMRLDSSIAGTQEYEQLTHWLHYLSASIDKFVDVHDDSTDLINDKDVTDMLFDVSQQLELVKYQAEKRYYDLNKKDLIAVGELPPSYPDYGHGKKLVYQDEVES